MTTLFGTESPNLTTCQDLETVLAILDRQGFNVGRVIVREPAGGEMVIEPERPGGRHKGGLIFSATEQLLLAVCSLDWQTAQQIIDAARLPGASVYRVLLTNLAEREYLESSPKGYRLRMG